MIYYISVISMTGATLTDIFINSPVLPYGKNQLIIHANDIPSGIFYLKKGFVKKTALLENGREVILRMYKAGSLFPLAWAFTDIDYYYYTTVTPVELQKIAKDAFISYVKTNPEVLFTIVTRVVKSENELYTAITHLLSGNSYHRVVASLLLCVKRFGMSLPLTHQEIADITGLTRETVSLVMIKLKKKKIISSSNHTIGIFNLKSLQEESRMSDEESITL